VDRLADEGARDLEDIGDLLLGELGTGQQPRSTMAAVIDSAMRCVMSPRSALLLCAARRAACANRPRRRDTAAADEVQAGRESAAWELALPGKVYTLLHRSASARAEDSDGKN
jgi:hypothetical protein